MQLGSGSVRRLVWSVAVASLFGLAAPAGAQSRRPDCYVLSVGVDAYPQTPLKGCVNDARNMAQVFESQRGKLFERVGVTVLLDRDSNSQRIQQELDRLGAFGGAGDFFVVFLSGHGNTQNRGWYFVAHDNGRVHDMTLLRLADHLAGQGKKVLVIVDACFAGQLRVNARDQLNKNYPQGGGVILMVSSMPSQMSAALGQFSAFAQAVFEGLSGYADFDGDGFITLREVRRYAYQRVHDLVADGRQDGEIEASLSVNDSLKLAKASKPTTQVTQRPPLKANAGGKPNTVPNGAMPGGKINLAGTTWSGRENLQGFGDLAFRFAVAYGHVTMVDTAGSTQGTYTIAGDQVTLTFNNGQTVYTGRVQGNTLSGTARGGRGLTWSWSVRLP
jgi:hypothetical protein